MKERLEVIFKRRSIRKYQDRKVEQEMVDLLLQAAMAAPSAVDYRPLDYIVATSPEVLAAIEREIPHGNYDPPLAIVICGVLDRALPGLARDFWIQDASAAMENLLIAAAALDLGACWIGVWPLPEYVAGVSRIFDLPHSVIPLAIAYVGYPAEDRPARTQYDASRIHHDVYRQELPEAVDAPEAGADPGEADG